MTTTTSLDNCAKQSTRSQWHQGRRRDPSPDPPAQDQADDRLYAARMVARLARPDASSVRLPVPGPWPSRELYRIDVDHLLFVASGRISRSTTCSTAPDSRQGSDPDRDERVSSTSSRRPTTLPGRRTIRASPTRSSAAHWWCVS